MCSGTRRAAGSGGSRAARAATARRAWHLLLVRLLQELELHDRALPSSSPDRRRGRRRRGGRCGVALSRGRRRGGREPAQPAARREHPALVAARARALARGPDLVRKVGAQRVDHLVEVLAPQARVPVREHGRADRDVGVRELARRARHVLADEGHRELEAAARHARVGRERRAGVVLASSPKLTRFTLASTCGRYVRSQSCARLSSFLQRARDERHHLGRELEWRRKCASSERARVPARARAQRLAAAGVLGRARLDPRERERGVAARRGPDLRRARRPRRPRRAARRPRRSRSALSIALARRRAPRPRARARSCARSVGLARGRAPAFEIVNERAQPSSSSPTPRCSGA